MKMRTKILAGVVIVLAVVVSLHVVSMLTRESRLQAACSQADRIVVNLNVHPKKARAKDGPILPSVELRGRNKVDEFFDVVTLKTALTSWRCLCYGKMLFEFYNGSELLATVSYHHGRSLFWRDGKWSGHSELTDESKIALEDWLKANGCPTTAEAEQIVSEACKAKKAAEEKAAEGD